MKQLSSIKASEREAAGQTLKRMNSELLPLVEALLLSPRQQLSKGGWFVWAAGVLAASAAGVYSFYTDPNALLLWFLVSGIVAMSFAAIAAEVYCYSQAKRQPLSRAMTTFVQSLLEREDVYALLCLLEILQVDIGLKLDVLQLRQNREAVRWKVIRLLPSLALPLSTIVQPKHRAHLLDILQDSTRFVLGKGQDHATGSPYTPLDVPLSLAILEVLPSLGSAESLRYVFELIHAEFQTEEVNLVRAAAINSLHSLRVLVEEQEKHSALLRASEEPSENTSLLLPVTEKPTTGEQELLRSVVGTGVTAEESGQLLRAAKEHAEQVQSQVVIRSESQSTGDDLPAQADRH